MKYFLKYATHNEYEESFIQTTPQVSLCKKENHVNYKETKSLKAQYFTVESLEDNNVITLYQGTQTNVITIKVSIDDGNTWTSFTSAVSTSKTLGTLNKGQRMLFKGTNARINSSNMIATGIRILTSKTCNLLGNLCSIINENTFETLTNAPNYNHCFAYMFITTGKDEEKLSCKVVDASKLLILNPYADGCYYGMFYNCSSLTVAPKLSATTLAIDCYREMFYNCTSLTVAPELPATTLSNGCYQRMFYNCTSLTVAPELPATTLAGNCYGYMFCNCTSLTVAPELPATTLTSSCYTNMFYGCTSLTVAPELPATTLTSSCYTNMFYGCTSLTVAPELPATTLANNCYGYMFCKCKLLNVAPELPVKILDNNCYNGMFYECTSLTIAPELPATTLANSCYTYMFYGCKSLTVAPELPATTLANNCYAYMFCNCNSLNYIKCLATNISATNCTQNWVSGVAKSGTFIGDTNYQIWERGVNGVPQNWETNVNIKQIYKYMYIDDFPSTLIEDEGEEIYSYFANHPGESGANKYEYFGETIEYNGNDYYLWEYYFHNDYPSVHYILTEVIPSYYNSLAYDTQNRYNPVVYRLSTDFEIYDGPLTSDNLSFLLVDCSR